MPALTLDTYNLTKRFGAFTALDGVSLGVRPGTVHALLGENGAGKSTLVKCVAGYHKPDDGSVMLDGREHDIASPAVARELGIGMVYQHFTVVPGLSVAENLLLARGHLPLVLDWRAARAELEAFFRTTPFQLPLDATPLDLSAGEKQKLEILKQLFLRPRLLILDEPTSVLTPQEADEVLGALRARAHSGACSIVLITHKFREVTAYADDVSVLRRGRLAMSARVAGTSADVLAEAMIGERSAVRDPVAWQRLPNGVGAPVLQIERLSVRGDRGEPALRELSLTVRAGEIVGMAGVSGNGQRELMQSLTGQRVREGGTVRVDGRPYRATRSQNHLHAVRSLPEEPLANACVGELGVGSNMALRGFDRAPLSRSGWMLWRRVSQRSRDLIAEFGVKTQGEKAAMRTLSGGNVQRAVLARELSSQARLLLVANPVFGLDFAAVGEIHARLMAARNGGAAVLLISEDLDELLELSDRIVVISEGRIVHETAAAGADRRTLGAHMGGRAHATHEGAATTTPDGMRVDERRAA